MAELTVFDGYCGAGGSSSGAEAVPGVRVRYAVNHWALAIDTHNHNMPHVDHDRVDLTDEVDGDPRRYAATDLGWFSPECTTWSGANGEECDYDAASQQLGLLDEEPVADEAKQRSRFQMETVPLFAEHHRYRALIVENVTDILKWANLDAWLARFRALGYRHRTVILNSAFAHQLGAPAPQLRDRVYFVFWQERYADPDFDRWTRPAAWCPGCDQVVRAVYVAKPGRRRAMRYGQQYDYRCPSVTCRNSIAHPYVLAAAAAIDWSLPAVRIGDRTDPLKPKTMARIAAGLVRHLNQRAHPPICPPLLVPAGGTWNTDATTVDEPMRTRTTRETEGLLVPTVGRDGVNAQPATRPHRTQTGRHETALVVPLRRHGVGRPADTYPAPTFSAGGTHHALVIRNNTARGGQGHLSTPVHEPIRTLTTAGHQSLIEWGHALYAYDTGALRPLGVPLPTQTVVAGDALVGTAVAVEDCTFRMLDVHEIKAGMAFRPVFEMPWGAKRDKVRMLGNAVTPPAARDLIAAVVEAVTGDEVTAA